MQIQALHARFHEAHAKFGALILHDTGRKTKRGFSMLDYELTTAQYQYPLDAVVFRGKVMANSSGIETICENLGHESFGQDEFLRGKIKQVLLEEGSEWAKDPRWELDDLSQRQCLLEGSVMSEKWTPIGTTVTFRKPTEDVRRENESRLPTLEAAWI